MSAAIESEWVPKGKTTFDRMLSTKYRFAVCETRYPAAVF